MFGLSKQREVEPPPFTIKSVRSGQNSTTLLLVPARELTNKEWLYSKYHLGRRTYWLLEVSWGTGLIVKVDKASCPRRLYTNHQRILEEINDRVQDANKWRLVTAY